MAHPDSQRSFGIDQIIKSADFFIDNEAARQEVPRCLEPARRIRGLGLQGASEFRDVCIRKHWNALLDERDARYG